MRHLIFDYETLSANKRTCPIVALAYIVFDDKRMFGDEPYTLQELRAMVGFHKFNIADQVENYDRRPNRKTLEWWKTDVDEETRNWLLTPRTDDELFASIPGIFAGALKEVNGKIICRGETFDMFITYNLCEQLGVDLPWPFWNEWDSRSLIDGVLWQIKGIRNNFMPPNVEGFKAHNPIDDVAVDVLRLQYTQRLLNPDIE